MTHQRLREKAEAVVAALAVYNADPTPEKWNAYAGARAKYEAAVFFPEYVMTLLAELDAARKDAERYRWLRKMYRASSPHMDGTFEHRPPMHAFRGRTLDDAIDDALNADGEKQDGH